MTEFEKGYEQGYKDGVAGAALPNVNDNGDKIDGYSYAYKTDSRGEPYIHIDSVRSMLKKATDVQPVRYGRWIIEDDVEHFIAICSECGRTEDSRDIKDMPYCHCGARMDGDKANNVRNLTDEETEIYESWIDHEAKDTGVNIMDGDVK